MKKTEGLNQPRLGYTSVAATNFTKLIIIPISQLLHRHAVIIVYCMPVQKLLNMNNYIICYCMPVQKLLNYM